MSQYKQKISNYKPDWYLILSGVDKQQCQQDMHKRHKYYWNIKPIEVKSGSYLTASETVSNITKGKKYKIMGHFCTLMTSLNNSEWLQFVTFKNDNNWTVKMNINHFDTKLYYRKYKLKKILL